MERARKEITLTDGRKLLVEESTWESAGKRSAMEENARAEKAKLNGSGDPVRFYFIETFYAYMVSCSTGSSLPDVFDALSLPDQDLDSWFEAVVEVNPDSFLQVDRSAESEVVFRDGSSFRIVSAYRPSVALRRVRLEEEALQKEADRDNPKDIFSVYLYPILAACSIGETPSPDEIRSTWPETEIYKWRDAVKEINPQWFNTSEEEADRTLAQSQETQKKRGKSRKRSRPS
jgi:hypothetical protein